MSDQELEKRLEDLEVKFAFQTEMIEDLNKTVTEQWAEIDRQKKTIDHLKNKIEELEVTGGESPENRPPPHY